MKRFFLLIFFINISAFCYCQQMNFIANDPLPEVQNVELRQYLKTANEDELRMKSTFGRGAWIGAIVGAGVGIITGAIKGNESCYPNCIAGKGSTGENMIIYGSLGAASGSLIGGTIGLFTYRKVKRKLPIE